jgi:predicted restriction endonuclease
MIQTEREPKLYRCNACGFEVPADIVGSAIMLQHLQEHKTPKE